jgi:hypothetical protein
VCEAHPNEPWMAPIVSAAAEPACRAPTAMSRVTASGRPWATISFPRLIEIRGLSTSSLQAASGIEGLGPFPLAPEGLKAASGLLIAS